MLTSTHLCARAQMRACVFCTGGEERSHGRSRGRGWFWKGGQDGSSRGGCGSSCCDCGSYARWVAMTAGNARDSSAAPSACVCVRVRTCMQAFAGAYGRHASQTLMRFCLRCTYADKSTSGTCSTNIHTRTYIQMFQSSQTQACHGQVLLGAWQAACACSMCIQVHTCMQHVHAGAHTNVCRLSLAMCRY